MRLDKFLGQTTPYSRSEAKQLLKAGRVSVNGQMVKKGDLKIAETSDQICLDGEVLHYQKFQYFMLNKPAGLVSARVDNRYPTVLSLFDEAHQDLFPVGRLDLDTEGLLLMTNDGDLAHRLLSPKKHVDKTYYVELAKPLKVGDKEALEEGIQLKDFKSLPAQMAKISETSCHLTIQEGKFHQVKRLFLALGNEVTYLKRVSMGPLRLDESLPLGEYRPLSEEELLSLQTGQ